MQESLELSFGPSVISSAPPPAAAPAAPTPPATPSMASQPSPRPGEPPAATTPAPGPDRIKVGDREWTAQELNDVASFKAAEDSKRLTLPANAEAYKVELPQDFKMPEGVTFSFKQDDPILAQARAMAHAKGWSQSDFSDALGIYAATQAQDLATLQRAKQAEINKLGPAGPARLDHVTAWLKSVGGPDADILCRTLDFAPVAATVQAFERMMQRWSSQGGSSFSQQHRSNPDDSKIPGYDGMSFEQRRHAQEILAARRR